MLDTGTWNQLGDFGPFLRELPAAKVVIDHHLTQDDLGAVRLVDTTAEATGRLVFEAIRRLGVPLPPSAAHACSWPWPWTPAGSATATPRPPPSPWRRNWCVPAPATELLYEQLFEQNTLPRLKLMGLVLDRLQVVAGGRVAYTEIRRGDYEPTGATPQDTRGPGQLHPQPGRRRGRPVLHGAAARRREGQFPLARRVDVARLAEKFGGGGHRLASGAVVEAPLDEARTRVLEAVLASLNTAG